MNKIRRRLRYYIIRLLRIRQGSHQIALGFVLGFFPCWYPTFGIGPALSIGLSKMVKGNIPSAIIAASLGSIAWPVLFYLNYKVGFLLRSLSTSDIEVAVEEVLEADVPDVAYAETAGFLGRWGEVGMDFILGSSFNSIVISLAGYGLIRFVFSRYRESLLKLLRH